VAVGQTASLPRGVRLARAAISPRTLLFLAGLLLLAVAPFFLSFHYKDLVIQAFIFAVLAISFDLLWGYTGVLSLGHAAFFGVGAYAIGVAVTQIGPGADGVAVGISCGIAGAVILALVVGWVAFNSRVPPIYIAVITLASALILQRLAALTDLQELSKYTGGYNGLSFFVNFWSIDDWYILTASALVVATIGGLVLANSDFGRVLVGIRDNERRMSYLGYNVPRLKLVVFVGSAAVAALAGMAYGSYIQRADPVLLGLAVSIDVLIVVSVGGRGTIIGPVLAAIIMGGQSSPFGLIGPTISERWVDYWQLILGLIFILVVLLLPRGLYPALRSLAVATWGQLSKAMRREAPRAVSRLVPEASSGNGGVKRSGEVLGRVVGVEKSFGALRVLRGVSLDMRAGEILCIVGPNGAGKSTLINIITDTREVSDGSVVLQGSDRKRASPARVARLGVGRTFQGANLMETYTVADSLFIAHRRGATPSLWRRTSEIPASAAVLALDQATGLTEVLDIRVADLSHGKRQALELSMALALEPELLLLDEPTAGLTQEERATVGELLRNLRSRGLGIVLIEHDLDFVRTITDRVAVLHQGVVGVEGPVEEVVGSALVREIYLGVKA
jgi:branched-chain amino acid transport system permease protein